MTWYDYGECGTLMTSMHLTLTVQPRHSSHHLVAKKKLCSELVMRDCVSWDVAWSVSCFIDLLSYIADTKQSNSVYT